MTDSSTGGPPPAKPGLPRWGVVGGVLLLAVTAAAAPFYGQVMGGLIWAGETLKALCGW